MIAAVPLKLLNCLVLRSQILPSWRATARAVFTAKSNQVHACLTGAAGSAWRRKRYQDFVARASHANLQENPEVQALLASIGQETAVLEEMWQNQQAVLVCWLPLCFVL